jgi:hypothetical protein
MTGYEHTYSAAILATPAHPDSLQRPGSSGLSRHSELSSARFRGVRLSGLKLRLRTETTGAKHLDIG